LNLPENKPVNQAPDTEKKYPEINFIQMLLRISFDKQTIQNPTEIKDGEHYRDNNPHCFFFKTNKDCAATLPSFGPQIFLSIHTSSKNHIIYHEPSARNKQTRIFGTV